MIILERFYLSQIVFTLKKSKKHIIYLTAACCPKRDFYTHTQPTKKETDLCTARPKMICTAKKDPSTLSLLFAYFFSFQHTFSAIRALSQAF